MTLGVKGGVVVQVGEMLVVIVILYRFYDDDIRRSGVGRGGTGVRTTRHGHAVGPPEVVNILEGRFVRRRPAVGMTFQNG